MNCNFDQYIALAYANGMKQLEYHEFEDHQTLSCMTFLWTEDIISIVLLWNY